MGRRAAATVAGALVGLGFVLAGGLVGAGGPQVAGAGGSAPHVPQGAAGVEARPPAAGRVVASWAPRGRRVACPPLGRRGEGGCRADAVGGPVDIEFVPLLGRLAFDSCYIDHTVHIGPTGRTAMSGILVHGGGLCGDTSACFAGDNQAVNRLPLPWEGRLELRAGGRIVNVVDACFDTCIGRFAGPLEIELRPAAGAWRAAVSGQVGASGWLLDGRWRLDMRGLAVRARGAGDSGAVTG